MRTTENILDSLVSFYQQERMWVYRTRAQLEDMQDSDPSDCSTDSQLGESSRHPLILPSLSLSTTSAAADSADSRVEHQPPPSSLPPEQPVSRWERRKQAYKMRLDLGQKSKRTMVEQSAAVHSTRLATDGSQPSVHILELYDTMMESRMESCQRINRLIRNANRANLHLR